MLLLVGVDCCAVVGVISRSFLVVRCLVSVFVFVVCCVLCDVCWCVSFVSGWLFVVGCCCSFGVCRVFFVRFLLVVVVVVVACD